MYRPWAFVPAVPSRSSLVQLLEREVRRAKVPEQLLEALVAIGLAVGVALEAALLELPAAVRADEALGVELVRHGGDDAALQNEKIG